MDLRCYTFVATWVNFSLFYSAHLLAIPQATTASVRGAFARCPTTAHTRPRVATNTAQHKIAHLLKTRWDSFVMTRCTALNVWPKTTLLPAWPRDAKRLGSPGGVCFHAWQGTSLGSCPFSWVPILCCILVFTGTLKKSFHEREVKRIHIYGYDWYMWSQAGHIIVI